MDVDGIPAPPSLLTIRVESTNMNYTVRDITIQTPCSEILDELAVAAHDAGYNEVDSQYLALVIKSDWEDSYDFEVDTSWTYGQLRDYLEQMGDGTIWVESGDGAEL